MAPLRIMLVDDSRDFLTIAQAVLSNASRAEIIGQAYSGDEAVRLVDLLLPDIVLMDVAMPRMNGIDATRCIKAKHQKPRIIIVSLNDSPEYRATAIAAGADGFVCKSEFVDQVLPIIDRYRRELATSRVPACLSSLEPLKIEQQPNCREAALEADSPESSL